MKAPKPFKHQHPFETKKGLNLPSLCTALAFGLMLPTAPLMAQDTTSTEQRQQFELNIPAQNLSSALNALSVASRSQVSVNSRVVSGRTSQAIDGTFTVSEALQQMVRGSGLVVSQIGDKSYTLMIPEQSAASPQAPVEEIVVTGSYTRQRANSATGLDMSLRETPQSITVMTQARMDDQNLHEISEVLNQAVGITFDGSTLGSDGTYFYSRGFSVTNYQLDGIPRPSGIYGFQGTTSDMTSYDRIEIVRGATGLMNGAGNPSASINYIRKRPSDESTGDITAQTGSWGRQRFSLDIGGALVASGRVRGRLAASTQESDSYIDRIHLSKKAIYGVVEVDVTDNTLLLTGMEYQDFENDDAPRGGLPLYFTDDTETNFPRSSNGSANWGKLENSSLNIFTSLEHRFANDWLVKLTIEHAEPKYDERMGYMSGEFDSVTGIGSSLYSARWASELEQDFIGAYAQGGFDWLGREQDLVFGLTHSTSSDDGQDYCGWWCGGDYRQTGFNAYELIASGGGVTEPDLSPTGSRYGGRIEQTGVYAALRLRPLENFALVIGSRITRWKEREWSQSEGEAKSYGEENKEDNVVTPYIGAIFDINDYFSVYASYTSIFEPQNYKDINGDKLDPLEGNNYEFGTKADFFDGRLSASAGIFRIEQDNYAIYVDGAFGTDGGRVYRAESGTVSTGFEVEIAGELLPGWQMVGGFSRAEPKDADDIRLLTDIPRDNFKLFSSYTAPGKNLTFGGNLRWQGKVYIEDGGFNYDTYYEQSSLALVDLMAKYAFSNNLSVQLNLNNIFDKSYYSGFGYSVNYGEPRSINASVKWGF